MCVNPYHYTPTEIQTLVRPLVSPNEQNKKKQTKKTKILPNHNTTTHPLSILFFFVKKVAVLKVLDYIKDVKVSDCLEKLGWREELFVNSPGDFATANGHLEELFMRVRELTEASVMAAKVLEPTGERKRGRVKEKVCVCVRERERD